MSGNPPLVRVGNKVELHSWYVKACEERDQLKDENLRLIGLVGKVARAELRCDQLVAENERLRAHNKQLLRFKVLGSPIETNADNAVAEA